MRTVHYSDAFADDLKGILSFTDAKFGRRQRKNYSKSIEKSIALLVTNPRMGKEISDIKEGCFRAFIGEHCLFYRFTEHDFYVVRLLAMKQHYLKIFGDYNDE